MKISKAVTKAGVVIITATLLVGAAGPIQHTYAADANGMQSSQAFSVKTSFKDVPSTHWASMAIQSAVAKGYFKGYSDGTFRPSAPVTKEEFAVLMSRVSTNESKSGYTAPVDVSGRWSESGVADAMAKGFVDSSALVNGKFVPQAKLTRSEMAKWMVRGLWQADDSFREATLSTVDTVVPVAEFYKGGLSKQDYGYVSVAMGTGMMNGFTNGSFGPSQTTTRAEVASILLRLEKVQEKKAIDFSQLLELVEVGIKGTNAEVLGIKFTGSNSGNPDDIANIRGLEHSLKSNKGSMRINRMIVVDPSKKDSLYYKMFVGKEFSPDIVTSNYMLFTLVEVTPTQTVANWGNQLDWHNSRLTASMPYTSDSMKSYGYPYIPRDIQNYLVKGKTIPYWSFSSIAKKDGQVQVKVGSKVLSFSTR